MEKSLKALIFDMDGVIIDSEPLWRKAMITGFTEIGLDFTEDDCRKTTGMRFKEVVEYWLNFYQLNNISVKQIEDRVLGILIELIQTEGKAISGALELIGLAKSKGWKIGLATSSYERLVEAVLTKLNIAKDFDAIVSAEKMRYGKPHPEVYLVCASRLGVQPGECAVIEDSVNGVIAGKAAQMLVFSVPDIDHRFMRQFAVADHPCENMKEVHDILIRK